jgi:hypothetical protein
MGASIDTKRALDNLLNGQMFAALSTWGHGRPYGSLVAFASCDDMKRLIFATPKHTRKYSNLMENPYVAMLIDDRSNDVSDFAKAMAATADGLAYEPGSDQRERFTDLYLCKHPNLDSFVNNETCALFVVDVEVYHVVSTFQSVVEIAP